MFTVNSGNGNGAPRSVRYVTRFVSVMQIDSDLEMAQTRPTWVIPFNVGVAFGTGLTLLAWWIA